MTGPDAVFEAHRPLLFGIAYRMLGTVGDAEDVLQDAFLRFRRAVDGGQAIESPKAYLSATVTRLSIDALRSARAQRETYVGAWLPAPLVTDERDDPAAQAEQADTLSMAFLLLLERLNPVERAVLLLHDVFGYDFAEIAGIVERSEANCRQIALRARRRVQEGRPRFEPSHEERERLAERFFAATAEGDVDGLVALLAEDVVVTGDGGGKVPQWGRPIVGAARVAHLFANLGRRMGPAGVSVEPHEVNGQAGALVRDPEGRLVNVFALDIRDGAIVTIRSVINPDKLRHLGPLADVRALLRGD